MNLKARKKELLSLRLLTLPQKL